MSAVIPGQRLSSVNFLHQDLSNFFRWLPWEAALCTMSKLSMHWKKSCKRLLALCGVLLPAHLDPYPAGLKQLSQKMKALRTILYAGTLLLVVTMLLKNATFQWALAGTAQAEAEDEQRIEGAIQARVAGGTLRGAGRGIYGGIRGGSRADDRRG